MAQAHRLVARSLPAKDSFDSCSDTLLSSGSAPQAARRPAKTGDGAIGRAAAHFGQQTDCGAIAIEGADIDIRSSGFHAKRYATFGQIGVDQRADILVGLVPV